MAKNYTLKMTSKTRGLVYAYKWTYQAKATQDKLAKAIKEADAKGLTGVARTDFIQSIPRVYKWESLGRWGEPGTTRKLKLEGIEDKDLNQLADQYEIFAMEIEVYHAKIKYLEKEYPRTHWETELEKDVLKPEGERVIPNRYDKYIEKIFNQRKANRIEKIMEETGFNKDKANLLYLNEEIDKLKL